MPKSGGDLTSRCHLLIVLENSGARQPWVLVYTWRGSGKLFNHAKPAIPHLCNGDNTTALMGLSGGLTEILCVIHLALCLANNKLPVKGNDQCY